MASLLIEDFFPSGLQPDEVAEPRAAYGGAMSPEPDSLERRARALVQGAGRLLAAAYAELPRGGPENIDDVIDRLLALERSSQELFGSNEEVFIRALEALRDCRWQLMALRAELRRDEGGPIFESAEALRRYAASLNL